MNTVLNNLIIYNGYPLSIVAAVLLHSLILVFLIWLQSSSTLESLELVQPTIIKALTIDENPQTRNKRIIERQRIEELERENQSRLQQEQELEQEAEGDRLEQQAEERSAALRERAELERQRELEKQREEERERQELQNRQERDLAQEEFRRQNEANRNRELAENAAAEAAAARTELELVQSATAIIQQAVQQVWNRPPSARNGMRAILQIRMLPTGELLDVRITETSGDPAFDRASENAIYSAAPFIELADLPINIFNTNFRTLSLIFQPEDLLN